MLKTTCALALPTWHGCGICAVEIGGLIVASYIAGQNRVLRLGLNFAYSKDIHDYVTRVAYLYRRNRWETLLREGVETR